MKTRIFVVTAGPKVVTTVSGPWCIFGAQYLLMNERLILFPNKLVLL